MDLNGQTVIVTGAAGNLGRAVVHAFAGRGANVALVDRRVERLVDRYGPASDRTLYLAADLGQAGDGAAVARQAHTRFGRIDMLCNLAGAFRMGEAVHETSDATWDLLFDANV